MIFDCHGNRKYKYGNRHFRCLGYYVDTVGRNEKTIREYVRNQLQKDIATDQLSMEEFADPFADEPVVKGQVKSRPWQGAASNKIAIGELFVRLKVQLY